MALRQRLALVALAIAAGAVPAGAHEVDPTVATVLDAVEPAVDGLVVEVAVSVTTQLLVENRTADVLEILDDDGRPFLRIGPDGVEADVASPAWALSNSPFGGAALPAAGAEPRWRLVAVDPAWGWFDHRLHPVLVGPLDGGDEVAWAVPMLLGGIDVVARGHLERRTVQGGFTSRLTGSAQPFPEVSVQLLDGRLPGFLLRNTGAEVVTVLGAEGEPFARVGPTGAEVNRHSPTWLATARARGESVDGLVTDAAADPDWTQLGPDPSLAWLDERGRYPDDSPPDDVLAAGAPAVVLEWSVPLERAGEQAVVEAVTAWVPADLGAAAAVPVGDADSGGVPLWALAIPTLAAAAGVALLARRRTSTSTGVQ